LWMEGVGLGLARNIVQRYALETGSEQGFGIGEKVAHDCVDRPDDAAFIECIISEQPAIIPRDTMPPPIMPRLIWPVLVLVLAAGGAVLRENGNDKTAEACGQYGDACVRCSC
jgi:hypothetical protein